MPICINNFNHKEWEQHGLKDYGDFVDEVGECNQMDYHDHSTGEWFYVNEDAKTIYFGTWVNDNAPGASSYTYAEIFDAEDPEDLAKFAERKVNWESRPEWTEQDENIIW